MCIRDRYWYCFRGRVRSGGKGRFWCAACKSVSRTCSTSTLFSINWTYFKHVYRGKGAIALCGQSLIFTIALFYILVAHLLLQCVCSQPGTERSSYITLLIAKCYEIWSRLSRCCVGISEHFIFDPSELCSVGKLSAVSPSPSSGDFWCCATSNSCKYQ